MAALFLHGCDQDRKSYGIVVREYCNKLQKDFSIESFFIDGPHFLEKGFSWYKDKNCHCKKVITEDVNNTLDYIEDVIDEKGITILIGFSQGANLVDTFLRERNMHGKIEFAIIMSGYTSYFCKNKVPIVKNVVIMSSDKDNNVKPSMLLMNYPNFVEYKHDRGHKIENKKSEICKILDSLLK